MIACWILLILFICNIAGLICIIFWENNNTSGLVFWSVMMTFLPIISFFAYLLIGDGIKYGNGKIFKQKKEDDIVYKDMLDAKTKYILFDSKYKFFNQMTEFCSATSHLTVNNDFKIISGDREFFAELIEDIENAKSSINIECHIFKSDSFGAVIRELLIKKCQKGVAVKLLYDTTSKLFECNCFFKPLLLAGAKVCRYKPRKFPYIRHNTIYKMDRSFVIIDDDKSYVGSFDIKNYEKTQNLSLKNLIIKFDGEVSRQINYQFHLDFSFATKKYYNYVATSFKTTKDALPVQFLVSGACENDDYINHAYVKALSNAKESICITTDYFLPDSTWIELLKNASMSNVKVRIMYSNNAETATKYYASRAISKDLSLYGIESYLFDGTMHTKMLIIDDDIVAIGTPNIERKSLKSHFENSAIIYDKNLAQKCIENFNNDIDNCYVINSNCKLSKLENFYKKIYPTFN